MSGLTLTLDGSDEVKLSTILQVAYGSSHIIGSSNDTWTVSEDPSTKLKLFGVKSTLGADANANDGLKNPRNEKIEIKTTSRFVYISNNIACQILVYERSVRRGLAKKTETKKIMVPRVGFEPTTLGLEVLCSIQLSYRGT